MIPAEGPHLACPGCGERLRGRSGAFVHEACGFRAWVDGGFLIVGEAVRRARARPVRRPAAAAGAGLERVLGFCEGATRHRGTRDRNAVRDALRSLPAEAARLDRWRRGRAAAYAAFLGAAPPRRVLALGAGPTGIVAALVRDGRSVVQVETSLDDLRVSRVLARLDGLRAPLGVLVDSIDVSPRDGAARDGAARDGAARDGAEALPFAEGAFDAAVLGPDALASRDLRALLARVRRLVAPGGRALVLAERRPPFAGLGRLAGRPARPSSRRIRALLEEAGFARPEHWMPVPDLDAPAEIVPIAIGEPRGGGPFPGGRRSSGRTPLPAAWSPLRRRAARGRLRDFVAPAAIAAGAPGRASAIVDAARRALEAVGAVPAGGALERRPLRVTSNGCALLDLEIEHPTLPSRIIVKVPLEPWARARVANEARALGAVRGTAALARADRTLVPRLLFDSTGGADRAAVLAVERLPGRTAFEVLRARGLPEDETHALMAAAMGFLTRLHAATAERKALDGARYAHLVGRHMAAIAAAARDEEERRQIERLDRETREALVGTDLPLVRGHGDMNLSNILFDDGRLRGVIDWEFSAGGDLPVIDAFHLALAAARVRELGSSGAAVARRLVPWRLARAEEAMLEAYLAGLGIVRGTALALRAAYWARLVGTHVEGLRSLGSEWYEQEVRGPLEAFAAGGCAARSEGWRAAA